MALNAWTLPCPWCDYSLYVNARGGSGRDQGAGVEAAQIMREHVERHGKTWEEFLAVPDRPGAPS